MARRIMSFRAGSIVATAVLAGAVLSTASPTAARAAPTANGSTPVPAFWDNLYRYNQTNPIGFECITEVGNGVAMQPCDSTTPDDPYQDWAWGYPYFGTNNVFENKATGLCLNGAVGGVTMDPCDPSTYPDETWTWNSAGVNPPYVVASLANGECLNANAVTGSVTMDPCDPSTYPNENIYYLEFTIPGGD